MVLVVIAVGAGVAVVALGKSGPEGPRFRARTGVILEVGTATVESVGAPIEFPADVQEQVMATLRAYVDAAIVTPLRKQVADETALAEAFDAAALPRLAAGTEDRAVLLDEGLPRALGRIVVDVAPVPLTGLADFQGQTVLVGAGFDADITARTRRGTTTITRSGSFDLTLDENGAWRISAWTMHVERSGRGVTNKTTTTTTTTTAVPQP